MRIRKFGFDENLYKLNQFKFSMAIFMYVIKLK